MTMRRLRTHNVQRASKFLNPFTYSCVMDMGPTLGYTWHITNKGCSTRSTSSERSQYAP